jgi:hypothetical protein
MRKSVLTISGAIALVTLALVGCYKVTAGGKLTLSSGTLTDNVTGAVVVLTDSECTFGLTAQGTSTSAADMVPAKGEIQIVNHTAGIIFHGVVDQTGNDKYQSFFPTEVTYWGSSGMVQIGNGPAIPVNDFQLSVNDPTSGTPSVFLGTDFGNFSMVMTGTLEAGNVTFHTQ